MYRNKKENISKVSALYFHLASDRVHVSKLRSTILFSGFLQFLFGFYHLLPSQVLRGEYLPVTVSIDVS